MTKPDEFPAIPPGYWIVWSDPEHIPEGWSPNLS